MAKAPLHGILITSAILTGCGGAVTSKRAANPQQPRTSESRLSRDLPAHGSEGDISLGSGGFMFLRASGTEKPAVRELYAVFRRPPRKTDLEVQEFARADAYADSRDEDGDLPLGKPLYGETRLVYGNTAQGMYAVPTTAEAVCIGVIPNGGGTCGEPGPHGVSVAYNDASDGEPFLLYGLVGNDVASVDLVMGGMTRHAELGENAYAVELPDARGDQLERLILHLTDGQTAVLPLHV